MGRRVAEGTSDGVDATDCRCEVVPRTLGVTLAVEEEEGRAVKEKALGGDPYAVLDALAVGGVASALPEREAEVVTVTVEEADKEPIGL